MTPSLLSFNTKAKHDVLANLDVLIASRLLVQANSGGGKSRALRYLLEQTHGRVQHLVLDPEGEFASLRERFPYVLVGKDADVPADPKTAKLLCRRLMEIGASAVIDLYDLKLEQRREFVRNFLDELMHLPRTLWHPTLVVLDEAHVFAPERGHGESQALDSVMTLATQGRKRGYALIAATQRLSKLHKDVAAELINKLIGRTGLDVDMKRAGDELGMDKEARLGLRKLAAGTFYGYGPAIADEVTLVRTGAIQTTHPEAGKLAKKPPPAPAKVTKMLAQLKDLPQEASEELRTMEDLKRKVATLERELRTGRTVEKPVVDQDTIKRALDAAEKDFQREWSMRMKPLRQAADNLVKVWSSEVKRMEPAIETIVGAFNLVPTNITVVPDKLKRKGVTLYEATHKPRTQPKIAREQNGNGSLQRGEMAVLTAIAQNNGANREQISILAGYKQTTRDAYIRRLAAAGMVDTHDGLLWVTDVGMTALGDDFEPLPTGDALREHWMRKLDKGEARVLEAICAGYPASVSRNELTDITGYKQTTRDAYIRRLKTRKLVKVTSEGVKASEELFG